MPSLRQYARLIEDCERRALQGAAAEQHEVVPLFPAATGIEPQLAPPPDPGNTE